MDAEVLAFIQVLITIFVGVSIMALLALTPHFYHALCTPVGRAVRQRNREVDRRVADMILLGFERSDAHHMVALQMKKEAHQQVSMIMSLEEEIAA